MSATPTIKLGTGRELTAEDMEVLRARSKLSEQ
ncbi:unnamed protein product, partial [Rotaria sordida]